MEVAILTFDRLTALDAVGPYEVLRSMPGATVKFVAKEAGPKRTDAGSLALVADYELEEGYTLLCRAHAYEDLTIELLHYDEDMIRSGLPIQQGVAEVVSKDAVTHDMRHLVLRLIEPDWIKFFPGQYMDITIPGTETVRSFSMANTSSRESGLMEFVIKVYPDGHFSRFLAEKVAEGDRLEQEGFVFHAPDDRAYYFRMTLVNAQTGKQQPGANLTPLLPGTEAGVISGGWPEHRIAT